MSTEPQELGRSEKFFTLAGVLLGMLLGALDQTIVSTAGPSIQQDLQIEPTLYSWITTSYMVSSTVMVPLWGKLSDLFGRRRVLVTGISIFLVGSALCGLSQSTMQLIASRALQGLGAAALFTIAFAVLADLFPPSERGRYQGLFGGVWGIASVAGPLAGGLLTDTLGWHWVFFVNLPVGAVALTLILLKMPPLRPPESAVKPRVDLLGALLLALFTVPLLIGLSLGNPSEHLWMFGLSLLALGAFLWQESRAEEPILDLKLFHERVFGFSNAAVFLSGAAFLSSIVFLPLYLVNVVGVSATDAGMTLVPLTLGIVSGNILAGQLASRLGRYKPLMLGANALQLFGFCIMGFTLSPDSTQLSVTLRMVFVGLGLGLSMPLYTLAVQNAVERRQVGVATSTTTFLRQMGSTLGVAVMGTVFGLSLGGELAPHLEEASKVLPAEVVSSLGLAESGPHEEGAAIERGFDAQATKALVQKHHQARGEATPPEALAAVDALERGVKEAFTVAVSRIYLCALGLTLLVLLFTVFIPGRPLRRTHELTPTVTE